MCPQHDLLWERLTGREHVEFYGALKGLRGGGLREAGLRVLRDLGLHAVADKQVHTYSGGMKRR